MFKIDNVVRRMIEKGGNGYLYALFEDYFKTRTKKSADYHKSMFQKVQQYKKTISIYFSIENSENQALLPPWTYKTGVFPGKFNRLIGSGSEGTVIEGEWIGKKAAFKFVRIGVQKQVKTTVELLDDLNRRLTEMKALQEAKGSAITPFLGHFRY